MDKVLTIVILSSGRLVYFKKTVNSLRKTRIDQNQTQILLFLNGFGNEIKEDYREFLQNSGFDFKIFNEKGIKHSELVRLAIYKSREFDHILLCEDDWIFSPNLSINEINRMKELSFFYRQVCFSNFERLNLIKKGEVNQAYFTMNPSIISKLVRNKLIEDYDWVGDMSILDELEKNFAKTIGGDFGQSHYLFESSYFIVKHIGVFSTRHYLTLINVFGEFGEIIIRVISFNQILSWIYKIVLKATQNILLLKSKLRN